METKPDPMKALKAFDYVKYDERSQNQQDTAKNFTGQLALMIESLTPGRAKALAVTKLEECYMWIGKAIRDEQISRNGSAPLQEERKDG
jgi:hypothetical protein